MKRMEIGTSASYLEVAKLIKEEKTVFVVGAGISTSSGIPDFRSKGGFFENIKRRYGLDGEDIFTAPIVNSSEEHKRTYVRVMGEMKSLLEHALPSKTHRFLGRLQKSASMRIYTQNIDGLEEKSGIGAGKHKRKIVYLHGSLNSLACDRCHHRTMYTRTENQRFLEEGQVPCPSCESKQRERQAAGKRPLKGGLLLPDVVLYGGYHPASHEIAATAQQDRDLSLLVVMGTSLRVYGVQTLVRELGRRAKERGGLRVYVGREKPAQGMQGSFDAWFCGECDDFSEELENVIKGGAILRDLRRYSLEQKRAGRGQKAPEQTPLQKSLADMADRCGRSPTNSGLPSELLTGIRRISIDCPQRENRGDNTAKRQAPRYKMCKNACDRRADGE